MGGRFYLLDFCLIFFWNNKGLFELTVIVALKDKERNRIIMGADNQGTSGQICIKGGKKIICLDIPIVDGYGDVISFEKVYIGLTGNYWLVSYLEYGFDIPPMDCNDDFLYYLYNSFFILLSNNLMERSLVSNDGNILDTESGMLMVFKGKIYQVFYNLSVMECVEDYAVEGTGFEVAIGSLHTNLNFHKGMDYVDIVKQAILSCADKTIYCDDEIDLEVIKG